MSKMLIAAAAILFSGLGFAQDKAMAPPPPELSFEQRDAIRQAVGNPTRRISNVMRDAYRNPEATLGFFSVMPDHTVVEIWPGEGWYTEILAPMLHEEGRLIAAHFDPESPVDYFRESRAEFEKRLEQGRGKFDKVELAVLDYDPENPVAEPGIADRVLTFRNVHNWLAAGKEETQAVFNKMYEVLKPGGYLGLVEHSARPGTSLEQMIETGYVSEALVIELATEAGFELASRSPVNQNPQDTKDHPEGVWTLPPTLRLGYDNRAHYMAIGESDRMTLLFIKRAE
ncbi:class I SAM-dependent methyltransferase [Pseudomonas sp. OIL-1]|uniref:class I SAM-dependent methyltransferase n=1 Tax=Pseudomonas sp. OIL-1 TaxID=2706126 RepID=UPI0013A77E5F|nr:class I SAM-dependent methyltransferase [Pseudomonas sp. OIL-1]QIB52647.1 class I SAM-dependent methyltransferase [Pseudomonas sp. OIL-1]